jgi:DNA processing protein
MITNTAHSIPSLNDEQRLAWLRLIRSENIGPSTFRDLLNHFGSASDAIEAIPELSQRGGAKKAIKICSYEKAEQELEQAHHMGIQIICLGEPIYPKLLRHCDGAPPVLSVMGNPEHLQPLLNAPSISIVGSRNASMSGIKLTQKFADELGREGFVITSGLARGIDTAAHQAAVNHGTVAVMAGGLDKIYPKENTALYQEIVRNNGAILSEMPLGYVARAQDFPRRNRIVAGMSYGLLVVEAAKRSGSLISARLANEMGRLVFAIPGSPLDPRAEGANYLIKNGASLAVNPNDLIEAINPLLELPLLQQPQISAPNTPSVLKGSNEVKQSDREKFISLLTTAPIPLDDIIHHANISHGQAQLIVLELDLAGRIERHSGNRISLIF